MRAAGLALGHAATWLMMVEQMRDNPFGDRGLLSGQTKVEGIYIASFGERKRKAPDVLNAKTRRLMLRVDSARDGRLGRIRF